MGSFYTDITEEQEELMLNDPSLHNEYIKLRMVNVRNIALSVYKKWFDHPYMELDDFIQEGTIGLLHAIKNRDSNGIKGPFMVYAYVFIRGRIQMWIRKIMKVTSKEAHVDYLDEEPSHITEHQGFDRVMMSQIKDIVDGLPDREHRIIVDRYYNQDVRRSKDQVKGYNRIARDLGMSVRTVIKYEKQALDIIYDRLVGDER